MKLFDILRNAQDQVDLLQKKAEAISEQIRNNPVTTLSELVKKNKKQSNSFEPFEDDEEYEAWLDFLEKGGSTAEWEKAKKRKK